MRMRDSVAVTAALVFAAVLGAVAVSAMARDSDTPAAALLQAPTERPSRGLTGQVLQCAGGVPVVTAFTQEADRFIVTATLHRIEPDALTLDSPLGKMRLDVEREPQVEGEFSPGDLMIASGVVDEGRFHALDIRQGCPAAAVAEITPAPTAPPPPTQSPLPSAASASEDDDDDDDDDDGRQNGERRGPREGRGNGGRGDDDDD